MKLEDRSFVGLLAGAREMVPVGYVGIATNFHDGWGWYLLRAEMANDPAIAEVRATRDTRGACVALVSRDGLIEITTPCVRRHDKVPCDRSTVPHTTDERPSCSALLDIEDVRQRLAPIMPLEAHGDRVEGHLSRRLTESEVTDVVTFANAALEWVREPRRTILIVYDTLLRETFFIDATGIPIESAKAAITATSERRTVIGETSAITWHSEPRLDFSTVTLVDYFIVEVIGDWVFHEDLVKRVLAALPHTVAVEVVDRLEARNDARSLECDTVRSAGFVYRGPARGLDKAVSDERVVIDRLRALYPALTTAPAL